MTDVVALCGGFSPMGENRYLPKMKPERGRLGEICSLRLCGTVSLYSRVDRQAGERVGAVNGPRLDSLRPEIPTAREFFGFDPIQNYGAVFGADAPGYGAVIADFPRVYGVFYGAAAGAKHRKEAFH